MKKWIRYYAEAVPSKGIVRIMKQVWETNGSKPFNGRKHLVVTLEKMIPIETDIPLEEFETTINHSDFSALQSDDRFWSEKVMAKRYNLEIVRAEQERALFGYNKEPIEITE